MKAEDALNEHADRLAAENRTLRSENAALVQALQKARIHTHPAEYDIALTSCPACNAARAALGGTK